MKPTRSFLAGALMLGMLAGGTAYAQQPPDRPGRGFRGGGPGGPGPMLALRELNLTDAQQDQIRAIREQHRDEIRQAETQVRNALEAQRKAVETTPVNEGSIRSTTADLAEAQTNAAIVQAHVFSETWAVLTPAQQAQAKKLQADRARREQAFRQQRRGQAQQN